MHSEIKYFKAGDDIAAELDTSDGIVAGWFCCVGKKNAKALMRNKKPDFTGFAKAFCNKYPRREFGIHSCNVETGEVYSSAGYSLLKDQYEKSGQVCSCEKVVVDTVAALNQMGLGLIAISLTDGNRGEPCYLVSVTSRVIQSPFGAEAVDSVDF